MARTKTRTKALYAVTAFFETDRRLTPDEEVFLAAAIAAQITEPVDEDGDDLDIEVELVDSVSVDKVRRVMPIAAAVHDSKSDD